MSKFTHIVPCHDIHESEVNQIIGSYIFWFSPKIDRRRTEEGCLIVRKCAHLESIRNVNTKELWVQPGEQSSVDDGEIVAVAVQLRRDCDKPISIASKPSTDPKMSHLA